MKNILLVAVMATLAGCAVDQPQYGARYPQPSDPSQWRVVSVTPVPTGTGDQVATRSETGSRVEYTSQPITTVAQQNVYIPTPVYVPQPVYVEPSYWYPPVTLSLGFMFGNHWSRGGYGRGHYRGRR